MHLAPEPILESAPVLAAAPTPFPPMPESMAQLLRSTQHQAVTAQNNIDNIVPSVSALEKEITLEAQTDADFEKLAREDEEMLPSPAAKQVVAQQPIAAVPSLSPNTPAVRMEQVEMFGEVAIGDVRLPREEGAGARAKDSRAESIARAQQIARQLGVHNLTDDEYDIPTFIRRQQQQNPTPN